MFRRTFLFAPVALAAPQRRPNLLVLWAQQANLLPDSLAEQSLVFPRAFSACPNPELARRVFETGKFAHAIRAGDPALSTLLQDDFRQVNVRNTREVAANLSAAGPEALVVLTAEASDRTESARALHVPLALRFPGVLAPRTAPEILISHVDVMPTLLSLLRIEPPQGVQGRDLSALLLNRTADLPDSVYAQSRPGQRNGWRAVIRGYEKLVLDADGRPTGLYNLADDPGETVNLVTDATAALTRDAMLALARSWSRRTGDGVDPSGLKRR